MTMDPTDFSAFEAAALQHKRKRNFVRFYQQEVPDPKKTAELGYACHRMIDKAMVRVPGSRDETPVNIDDKFIAEYGDLYDQWKKTQEQPTDGLALELWPPIPKSLVEDWKFFGVRTVQHLASLGDSHAQKMGMGVIEWRKKAQAWLEAAKDHAVEQRLVSENENLRREIERLGKQVADLKRIADGAEMDGLRTAAKVDMDELARLVAAQMKNGAAQ
jgi:plasmid stabilization system protein ParE